MASHRRAVRALPRHPHPCRRARPDHRRTRRCPGAVNPAGVRCGTFPTRCERTKPGRTVVDRRRHGRSPGPQRRHHRVADLAHRNDRELGYRRSAGATVRAAAIDGARVLRAHQDRRDSVTPTKRCRRRGKHPAKHPHLRSWKHRGHHRITRGHGAAQLAVGDHRHHRDAAAGGAAAQGWAAPGAHRHTHTSIALRDDCDDPGTTLGVGSAAHQNPRTRAGSRCRLSPGQSHPSSAPTRPSHGRSDLLRHGQRHHGARARADLRR